MYVNLKGILLKGKKIEWLKRKTWLGTLQILLKKCLKVGVVVPPWQVHSWSILVASPEGLESAQKGSQNMDCSQRQKF